MTTYRFIKKYRFFLLPNHFFYTYTRDVLSYCYRTGIIDNIGGTYTVFFFGKKIENPHRVLYQTVSIRRRVSHQYYNIIITITLSCIDR